MPSQHHTIAFYNIENLFDTEDDPFTADNDFLPHSAKRWTEKRYQNKLRKIGKVISMIGEDNANNLPVIVGLAEVENKKVLEDLIQSKHLTDHSYNYVHFDSSDERGIDVALLYNSNNFEVIDTETFSVYIENENNERDYTRDILLVSGQLDGELIYCIVNHWSSRRDGVEATEIKRIEASKTVNTIIAKINTETQNAKIIVMGDFNDNPNNKSICLMEEESHLFNPFKTLLSKEKGSLNHRFEWFLFDQILISYNLISQAQDGFHFENAAIYDNKILTQYRGKYKGQPFRTYVGKRYKGGYSDHFPVYITLDNKNLRA